MKTDKKFEDALVKLKKTVEKLEGGNLSLDESLDLFENGVQLVSFCQKKLDEVEKKVEILSEDEKGGISRRDFDLNQ